MANEVQETSSVAEGSDKLREFLMRNQNELKLTDSDKFNEAYRNIKEELSYDDLIS